MPAIRCSVPPLVAGKGRSTSRTTSLFGEYRDGSAPIAPRPPSDWDAEVLDALAVMRCGDAELAAGNQQAALRVVNALGLLMRYPALAKSFPDV